MKMLCMTVFTAAIAASASAIEYTWNGSQGGTWNDASSWTPSTAYPDGGDTAVFASSATVTPPATFTGTLKVSAAVDVTLDVESTAAFKVLLPVAGSTLTKTGEGALTVSHAYGVAKGALVVADGPLSLAGNGATEAPGAFNDVVVRTGAAVSVVDSPIATAHGMIYRMGKISSDITWDGGRGYEVFYGSKCTYDAYIDGWENPARFYATDNASFPVTTVCYVPTNTCSAYAPAVYAKNGWPSTYASAAASSLGVVVLMHRGILLNETTASRKNYINPSGGDAKIGFTLFCDGAATRSGRLIEWLSQWSTYDALNNPHSSTGTMGWNALDFMIVAGFDSNHKYSYPVYTREILADGEDNHLSPPSLWYGACCNSLTVEEGASLTIADGQAFAIANSRGSTLAGSVQSATADAYLFLGAGYGDGPAPAASGLRDFKGTLRFGPTAGIDGDASCADATYTMTGSGRLGMNNGLAARAGVAFEGTVGSVPDDATLDWNTAENGVSCEKASAFYPITSDTWHFGGNVTIANEESETAAAAVSVLDSGSSITPANMVQFISKQAIPAYCPFEISADIYRNGTENTATTYGFFVQRIKGGERIYRNASAWDSRMAYLLDEWGINMGSWINEYSGACSMSYSTNVIHSASNPNYDSTWAMTGATPAGSWRWKTGVPNRYWLRYDGFGTIRSGYSTPYGDFSGPAYAYPQLTNARNDVENFYPGFFGLSSQNGSKGTIIVSNIVVRVQDRPIALGTLSRVGEGATLNATLAGRTYSSSSPARCITNAVLGAGAAISLAPKFAGFSVDTLVSDVTLEGGASLAVPSGATVTIGSLVCASAQSSIRVIGGQVAFATPIEFTVPDGCRDTINVVDFSEATLSGPVDLSQVSVRNASGRALRFNVHLGANSLVLSPCGFTIVFR